MKILIAYDGSAYADAAIEDLRHAGLPPENDVLLVSVAKSPHSMKDVEAAVTWACAQIRLQFPKWNVSAEVLWGEPANILHQTILRWMPDLVVAGSRGRSAVGRLLLGSISFDVVHHAPCSVRVVRARLRKPNTPERLLVANDGSLEANAALDQVVRRTWPNGTQVRVISVAESLLAECPVHAPALGGVLYSSDAALEAAGAVDARERARLRIVLDESAARLKEAGLVVSAVGFEGDPRSEIVTEANQWRADTVFLGARGLGALDRLLLGSVSTAVLTHAHCTVEIARLP